MRAIICEDVGGKDARCVEIESRPECDPRCGEHRQPAGYVDAAEWAEYMQQTHVQRQCPGCGRWTIWEPKSEEGSVTEDDLALVDAVARSIRDAYEELPDGTHPEFTEVYEWRGEARAAIRAIREAGAAA